MAKEKVDLRKRLRDYKMEYDLLQAIPCTKTENKQYEKMQEEGKELPAGVFPYVYAGGTQPTGEFYTVYKPELTDQEVIEYLTFEKLSFLKTIKNCAVFFTALTIIGLIASAILLTQ